MLALSRCPQGGDAGSRARSQLEPRGCPVCRGRRKKACECSSLVMEREVLGREVSFEQLLLLGQWQAVQISFAGTRKRTLFFFKYYCYYYYCRLHTLPYASRHPLRQEDVHVCAYALDTALPHLTSSPSPDNQAGHSHIPVAAEKKALHLARTFSPSPHP